jgi:hypothetical protein
MQKWLNYFLLLLKWLVISGKHNLNLIVIKSAFLSSANLSAAWNSVSKNGSL